MNVKKIVIYGVAGLVIGLVVGYIIFGKFNGKYLPPQDILFQAKGLFKQIGSSIKGVAQIRNNILISGGIGAAVGAVLSFLPLKK